MTPISEPIERSMPPEMTTTACAIAAKQRVSASIARAWMSNLKSCCDSERQYGTMAISTSQTRDRPAVQAKRSPPRRRTPKLQIAPQ